MEFEFWWLLGIPAFFTLGWLTARIDIRQLLAESRSLPTGYFKGLNLLLNDQHDKAVDTFIEIVRMDPEAIELHFALGSLFRRRGEVERAIRMHQNLLQRPDLPQEFKVQALYELGQDFLKAGLLDRAEDCFTQLLNGTYENTARRALLEIFQREKAWPRAIDAALALQESGAGNRQSEISQFYCELAQDELVHTHPDAALDMLDRALAYNRMNVRATMLTGDAWLAKGDIESALLAWRKVEQQSTAHVSLVAQRLMDGYRKLDRPNEGLNLLRNYLAEAPSIDLLEVVFNATLDLEGPTAANQLASDELRRTPNLLGLNKLLDARLLIAPVELRPELAVVKNLVHGYAQKLARYQCDHCGFKARQFYWQCPGCNRWETYPPRRSEELNKLS